MILGNRKGLNQYLNNTPDNDPVRRKILDRLQWVTKDIFAVDTRPQREDEPQRNAELLKRIRDAGNIPDDVIPHTIAAGRFAFRPVLYGETKTLAKAREEEAPEELHTVQSGDPSDSY